MRRGLMNNKRGLMKNKRGQYYLLAAVIIIAIIISFAGVSYYKNKGKSDVKIYDLKEELGVEGENVLDYRILSTSANDEDIKDFVQKFIDYAGDKKIYFVVGDATGATVYTQESYVAGTIQFGSSGEEVNVDTVKGDRKIPEGDEKKITIKLNKEDETPYEFTLKSDQKFYFIIEATTSEGETQIVTDSS